MTKEWALVEVQGELGSREETSLDGQFVGDLYYNREVHIDIDSIRVLSTID